MTDSEEPAEERRLSPEDLTVVRSLIARARRKRNIFEAEKRIFAFLLIVVYGWMLSGVDFGRYNNPTGSRWFAVIFFGLLLYVVVAALVRDDEPDDEEEGQ